MRVARHSPPAPPSPRSDGGGPCPRHSHSLGRAARIHNLYAFLYVYMYIYTYYSIFTYMYMIYIYISLICIYTYIYIYTERDSFIYLFVDLCHSQVILKSVGLLRAPLICHLQKCAQVGCNRVHKSDAIIIDRLNQIDIAKKHGA